MEVAEKNKLKVPKLRFRGFKDGWEETTLGEMLTFKNGVNASKEQYGSGYKFINVLDIIQNDFITHDVILGEVELSDKEVEKNEVKYGDILFQRSSETREEVGQANVYLDKEKTAVFGGFVIRGSAKSEYNPLFMNGMLKTDQARKEITTRSGGSTRYNIGQESLEAVIVFITSLPEQKKIADFLSAVDARIGHLNRKKELLETYKKGVMQQLFAQELRFKRPDGTDYPDWEEKRLGDLGLYISDGNYGEMYPTASQFKETGVPFIRANNIKNLKVVWDEMRYIDSELHSLLTSGHLKAKDVLVTTRGDIGTLGFVNDEFDGANINAQICLLRTQSNLNSFFLLQFLSSDGGKRQFQRLQTGSALKQLPKKVLEVITIPLPSIEEQQKIADFLSALDRKVEAVKAQLTHTQQFKKGLLQELFV